MDNSASGAEVVERIELCNIRARPKFIGHAICKVARLRACESADLCPDHGSAFRHPPERLAEVAAAAHKRHLEVVLVDVMGVICGRQHLQQAVYQKKHAADSKLCMMT